MTREDKDSIVRYRINRAKETLQETFVLIENKFLNNAVNRIYYACFYAVSALLLDNDIGAKSHAGAKQMLSLHFIKTEKLNKNLGDFYSSVFDMRHNGDYSDFFVFETDDVISLIEPATILIAQIENILSINPINSNS